MAWSIWRHSPYCSWNTPTLIWLAGNYFFPDWNGYIFLQHIFLLQLYASTTTLHFNVGIMFIWLMYTTYCFKILYTIYSYICSKAVKCFKYWKGVISPSETRWKYMTYYISIQISSPAICSIPYFIKCELINLNSSRPHRCLHCEDRCIHMITYKQFKRENVIIFS